MNRAERRRKQREKAKELLYDEFNKENYPKLSRQERKTLANDKAKEVIN
jgi:hypothetical protein